jgi:hypothetical protein
MCYVSDKPKRHATPMGAYKDTQKSYQIADHETPVKCQRLGKSKVQRGGKKNLKKSKNAFAFPRRVRLLNLSCGRSAKDAPEHAPHGTLLRRLVVVELVVLVG